MRLAGRRGRHGCFCSHCFIAQYPRLLTHTITSSSSHEAAGADMPRPLRRSHMMQAHTQIDRTTVPVLADSLQNHRGGLFFSSSSAAPDRCLGVPCARSRDSVGVRVQMQAIAGARTHGVAARVPRAVAPQPTPQVRLGLGRLMAGCIMHAWVHSSWAAGPALPPSPS